MIANTLRNSPVRQVEALVELYSGSTLAQTWTPNDRLISVTIERVGDETKFFGYGICQKANVHLIDLGRELHCATSQCLRIRFKTKEEEAFIDNLPHFFVTRNNRDEKTNELSVTAYDKLYKAASYTVSDLKLGKSYTIGQFVKAAADLLGVPFNKVAPNTVIDWDLSYPSGANYDGTEPLRDALDDVAEVTQSIYYISVDGLTFRQLAKDAEPLYTIGKSEYFALSNGDNRRLSKLVHTTELQENTHVETENIGTTQYIRDNPFWNLREDIGSLMHTAIGVVGDLTINQFDCEWRGNWYLEVGDKIGMVGKDDEVFYSYILNDVWEYDGSFVQKTLWQYNNSDSENEGNAASLGEALKQTFARVDKVAREIKLVASNTEGLPEQIAALTITTKEIEAKVEALDIDDLGSIQEELAKLQVTSDSINQEVAKIETKTNELGEVVEVLTDKVNTSVTADDVSILISQELEDGITSVTTTTGFVFDEDGLTIKRSGTNLVTQITEDGMKVYDNKRSILTADSTGVYATNLHAKTYLLIGSNSRLEDYSTIESNGTNGYSRTGCFWIGG